MTERHPLDLQRCVACGSYWALRPYACAACGGTTLQWTRASGDGVVLARSLVHRAPDATWRALVPYALVLVRLAEGPVLMGHADPDAAIDARVHGEPCEQAGHRFLRFAARRPP